MQKGFGHYDGVVISRSLLEGSILDGGSINTYLKFLTYLLKNAWWKKDTMVLKSKESNVILATRYGINLHTYRIYLRTLVKAGVLAKAGYAKYKLDSNNIQLIIDDVH